MMIVGKPALLLDAIYLSLITPAQAKHLVDEALIWAERQIVRS